MDSVLISPDALLGDLWDSLMDLARCTFCASTEMREYLEPYFFSLFEMHVTRLAYLGRYVW